MIQLELKAKHFYLITDILTLEFERYNSYQFILSQDKINKLTLITSQYKYRDA